MSATYRLAQRLSDTTSIVRAGAATFGDGGFTLVGGPCAIESASQIRLAAEGVRDAGGAMLRGGAYKPRTSPYDFQGVGDEGLPLIAEAGARTGLPVVVEALAVDQMPLVAAYVDMIQIGARNMQNVPLLRAAAATGLPILLKRGPSATLDELLLAAEYVLLEGNPRVVLCERGIRGFDKHTRNVCDLGGVEPLTLAAAAAGLDGAIVEVHPQPERALSDADQAIDLADFARLAARVRAVREVLEAPALAVVT